MENKVKVQKEIVDSVMHKIDALQSTGSIKFPEGYNVANAVQAAALILADTVDKNKNPVLESCTTVSIANSIYRMCMQGLDPIRSQCYFVAFGNKLTMMRSYQGSIALAKRLSGIKDVRGHCLFEGDKFEFHVDGATGKKTLINHLPKFENINTDKIIGAYAIAILADGTSEIEVMTMTQIKKAWLMGREDNKASKDFPDQMAPKTVINRLCKSYINSTIDDDDDNDDENKNAEQKFGVLALSDFPVIESQNVKELSSNTEIEKPEQETQKHKKPLREGHLENTVKKEF